MLDAHVHVWGPPSTTHPWVYPESVAFLDDLPLPTVYDVDALIADMDQTGIDEAVLVGFPLSKWTDNYSLVSAVEQYECLRGIGLVDVFANDAPGRVTELLNIDGILGIRLGVAMPYERMWRMGNSGATAAWLPEALDETDVWETIRDTGAQVQLWIHHEQLDQARELLETYPDVPVVIDHLACLTPDLPTDHPSVANLEALANYPGVGVKLSHVPLRSTEPFPHADMFDLVRRLFDVFGRERLFWGSDYQYLSSETSYAKTLHWLDHMETLSPKDRQWVRSRSFDRFTADASD